MQPSRAFQHFMQNVKKNWTLDSHHINFFSHINYKVAMHAMLSSLMMMFSYRVVEEYNLVANPIYNISESVQRTASTPRQHVQRTLYSYYYS